MTSSLPAHMETDSSGGGATAVQLAAGGVIKRRHSRGRSVTSKAEMMSRPNSAKASYNNTPPPLAVPPVSSLASSSTQAKEHRPTSPIAVSDDQGSRAVILDSHPQN